MNTETIRIAIAEACGWIVLEHHCWSDQSKPCGRHVPDGKWETIPDYLSDLNAMHEAEKVIVGNEQQAEYSQQLIEVLNRDHHGEYRFLGASGYRQMHATATQRAEAFLKTINKWTES